MLNELHYQIDYLKALNQKLTLNERQYRRICDTVSCAFIYYSVERGKINTLGRWSDFFDFKIEDFNDLTSISDMLEGEYTFEFRDVLYPEKNEKESCSLECKLKNVNKWYKISCRIFTDESGAITEKLITFEDVTKFNMQKQELTYMAYYDAVTGLYSRNYFVSILANWVSKAKEENNVISLMLIDIDDFRKINDGMGIVVGDELIQVFGSYLNEFSNDNVIICHFNNDVYCMAIYNPSGVNSIENIHKKIQNRIKTPFKLVGGAEALITVSVGVAEFPEASDNALGLINCAEIVMFKGKSLGRNMIQYFNAPILDDFLKSVEIENKLKEAVFNKNFEVYYQPQVYSGNKKIRGIEALIRWRDSNNQMISPSVFIPIAEKNGSIISIGKWVIERSISDYSVLRSKYGVDFVLSINISAMQYRRDDFVEDIISIINKYDLDPRLLELEITESVLIDDFKAVLEKLMILKDYGIRISLDDFGTGFSSLSYLKKLPIDTLKIDKSFIDTVLTDAPTRVITESIVDMVKALGYESIAEGVEDNSQYEYLHSIGCDIIQGYLFSKPLPYQELEVVIKKELE